LPGNVPLSEAIDRLLEAQLPFVVAYADLDNFKPFNDLYGYAAGDEMICLLDVCWWSVWMATGTLSVMSAGMILPCCCNLQTGSRGWSMLQQFDAAVSGIFDPAHLACWWL
jgi:hypothetical protein